MTKWFHVKTKDELELYYLSVIPKIKAAAKEHGYALAVHGSMRRDLDVIAVPWVEEYSHKQTLADAIQTAAVPFIKTAHLPWEQKPNGRWAISMHSGAWPEWYGEAGAGHIDLSVMSCE